MVFDVKYIVINIDCFSCQVHWNQYWWFLMFRYDEYGEGRTSASNSDQTGTLSRASYHSSDPEQYPDLLDIPNRYFTGKLRSFYFTKGFRKIWRRGYFWILAWHFRKIYDYYHIFFWNFMLKVCNIRAVRFFWNFRNKFLQCNKVLEGFVVWNRWNHRIRGGFRGWGGRRAPPPGVKFFWGKVPLPPSRNSGLHNI